MDLLSESRVPSNLIVTRLISLYAGAIRIVVWGLIPIFSHTSKYIWLGPSKTPWNHPETRLIIIKSPVYPCKSPWTPKNPPWKSPLPVSTRSISSFCRWSAVGFSFPAFSFLVTEPCPRTSCIVAPPNISKIWLPRKTYKYERQDAIIIIFIVIVILFIDYNNSYFYFIVTFLLSHPHTHII